MKAQNEFPWGRELSHVTNARIAAMSDWHLNFSMVDRIVETLSVGALSRAEVLGMSSSTAFPEDLRYTERFLTMLCGEEHGKHLWHKNKHGLYHLLCGTDRAVGITRRPAS